MVSRQGRTWVPCAALLLLLAVSSAEAARARFHYVPDASCGVMSLKPGASGPGEGETRQGLRVFRQAGFHPPGPAQFLTFQHPGTHTPVTVPVALPEGTPRIEHRFNQIIYNYGSYAVEIHFQADGSVDVVYDSGWLRAL